MSDTMKDYEKAKQAHKDAVKWINLLGVKGRNKEVFRLSEVHSSIPKLVIAGQFTTGGTNYWDSPSDLNKALLLVIHNNSTILLAEAMAILVEKEVLARRNCRKMCEELLQQISANEAI